MGFQLSSVVDTDQLPNDGADYGDGGYGARGNHHRRHSMFWELITGYSYGFVFYNY